LSLASGPGRLRDLAFASYSGTGDFSSGKLLLRASVGAIGTVGQTEGVGWQSIRARGSAVGGYAYAVFRYSIIYDQVSNGAPRFEAPVAGGSDPPLTDPALLSQRLSVSALPVGIVSGTQMTDQRLEYGMGPAILYYERLATPLEHGAVHDLYGGEARGRSPPIPFLTIPAAEFSAGLGYSISDPYKYKLRAFVTIRYSP
jgi:hypothetical protein